MKRLQIIIYCTLLISSIFINFTKSLDINEFTPLLDKKIASLKTTEEKVIYLQWFTNILTNKKYTQNKDAQVFKNIREYSLNMLNSFQQELNEEVIKNTTNTQNSWTNNSLYITKTATITNLPHLSDNFTNIDVEKVRNAILTRHNEERKFLGLNPYSYNMDLEWSATTRANKIASAHKTSNFHPRNNWDWYYNYNSMLTRFYNLWIKFPTNIWWWSSSFSESIWYNTYKCSKNNCTDELINAIKKTRTGLIMKEKSSNGSHYKAATMKHFTQMWIGIAIDKDYNRYYLVLHYGINF